MCVYQIYFDKHMKFITVVSNLETCVPLWFAQNLKKNHSMSSFELNLPTLSVSALNPLALYCAVHL